MKYAVYGVFTATKFLGEFDAETPGQAEEMAEASPENYFILCHQCASDIDMDDNGATSFVVEKRGE